jgi:hypothetical protein
MIGEGIEACGRGHCDGISYSTIQCYSKVWFLLPFPPMIGRSIIHSFPIVANSNELISLRDSREKVFREGRNSRPAPVRRVDATAASSKHYGLSLLPVTQRKSQATKSATKGG